MCGAAGRSSELNKPKGEGWWKGEWGKEEAGGHSRAHRAGPAAGFLGAVALFCTAHSGCRTESGRGGAGQGGSFPVFLMEGKAAGPREGRAGGENQVETRGSEVHPEHGAARSQEKGGAKTTDL